MSDIVNNCNQILQRLAVVEEHLASAKLNLPSPEQSLDADLACDRQRIIWSLEDCVELVQAMTETATHLRDREQEKENM